MLSFIDNILNRITMYRVVLYYLIALLLAAVGFSFFGVLPYEPFSIVVSVVFITAVSYAANYLFSRVFEAPTNVESVYITALILSLIIAPPALSNLAPFLLFSGWAALWATASKYLLAIKKKHLFNPAAFAVALTALALNQSANWWVGTAALTPFVLVGGLLMVRKLRRSDLVIGFFVTAAVVIFGMALVKGSDLLSTAKSILLTSPFLFFAFVMLTEPLTTPPTRPRRIWYGALVGALFAPFIHIGALYSTPELSLLVGNVFSYLVSPKEKLVLKLREKIQVAVDAYDFIFRTDRQFAFNPGQYLEWTLPHEHSDSRGNRRYFTIRRRGKTRYRILLFQ